MSKRTTPPRCPGCRALPVSYTEMWEGHSVAFDAKPDGRPEEIGYTSEGGPYCVWAKCSNGHEWRLHGVSQITDLREEPTP